MAVKTLTDYEIALVELNKMIYGCNDSHDLNTLRIIEKIIREKKEELDMKYVVTNCEDCMHESICGVKEQFREALTECPAANGPFKIELRCEFFRKEQPTRKGGVSYVKNNG